MNESPTPRVLHEHADRQILVLTIDNPPVNALSNAIRRGLFERIQAAIDNPEVRAIVLQGNGRCFSAGAEIREFGKIREKPWTGEVARLIETCPKPVVSALHGTVLGGGLELALGSHYRICTRGSTFGLPEVRLGLLPGGGGTQRLPRLVGAANALHMMLQGDQVDSERAMRMGLVDEVVEASDLLACAKRQAVALATSGSPPRRTCDAAGLAKREESLSEVDKVFDAFASKARGLVAPQLIAEAVRQAIHGPFDQSLRFEALAFRRCLSSPQREGLIHIFFAERRAARSPVLARPRDISSVGVIGGGTMGSGIAVSLLDAGYQVVMVERNAAALQVGQSRVAGTYDRMVKSGRMTADQRDAALSRFRGTTQYAALAEAGLVIEAAFEDMVVKKKIFTQIDEVCKEGAILATNTSYLDINDIAASTRRPQDVIGLHFFSPANIMKLLEIVVPDKVADDVVATGFELARALKKAPVRAGVCDGFIGNRILYVYREAASFLMEDGASPYEIDRALEEFGFAMGPFRTADLTGGDIGWATRKRKAATRDPRARYVRVADRICEKGWFGQKAGRGYYNYEDGSRQGQPDDEVMAIVEAERKAHGVVARAFSSDEIVERYVFALINEAAKVLEDGIALRPSDIDVAMVNGYGFPRWRGGPMKHADAIGISRLVAALREYAKEDSMFWEPASLLVQLMEAGKNFDSLNETH